MDYKIYLAKDGKTHGPFTPEEFEQIRVSGRISDYDSIFDSRSGGWQPLDVPPAPGQTVAPKTKATTLNTRTIEAVCHNFRAVTSGKLTRVSETGCDLVVANLREAGPCFAERGQVLLNLLDPSTGQSMDVTARLTSIARAPDGGWMYRLEWRSCPEILLAS